MSLGLLAAAITLAGFSPILRNEFVGYWDDNIAIVDNPDYNPPKLANLLHYWIHPPRLRFYVPMTYSLWGFVAMVAEKPAADDTGASLDPAWFHAESLLAHVLSTVLVFAILRQLLSGQSASSPVRSPGLLPDSARHERSQSAHRDWASFIGALLFGLHPIQVEAVAWASSVYSPLSGMFSLWAVWQYLLTYNARTGAADNSGKSRLAWLHLALATMGFVLAELTKPTAIITPLIIAVIEVGWRRRSIRDILPSLGAWMVIGLALVKISQTSVPAVSPLGPAWWPRIIVALDATAFYLWKLIWPAHLMPDYGRSPQWVIGHPWVWLSCLVPLSLLIGAWLYQRRAVWPITAIGVFAAALLPTLGLAPFTFQNYSTTSDRYAYLAMLGPAIAVAAILARSGGKKFLVPAALLLALLAGMSVIQLERWQNTWTLFDYNLKWNPDSLAANHMFRCLLVDHPAQAARACPLDSAELIDIGNKLSRQNQPDTAAAAYQLARSRASGDLTEKPRN